MLIRVIGRRTRSYLKFAQKELTEYRASPLEHLQALLFCKNTLALKMMHPEVWRRREYIPITLFSRRISEHNWRTAIFFRSKFSQQLWLERFFPEFAPPIHHYIGRTTLIPFDRGGHPRQLDDLPKLIQERGGLFLKPSDAGHGIGATHLAVNGKGFELNGAPTSQDELVRFAHDDWQGYVVSDIIRNSEWAGKFYGRTLNTFRILTGIRRDTREALILSAVFKMGVDATFPADNWQRGLGGVAAKVDLETGQLGPLIRFDREKRIRQELSHHPETGVSAEGEVVPDWAALKSLIMEMTARFPFSGLVGWDVAHTPTGFVVVEANGSPGIDIHEVHESLFGTEAKRICLATMNIRPIRSHRRFARS